MDEKIKSIRRISQKEHDVFPVEVAHIDERAQNMTMFHWHSFLEISLITSGCGVYIIENKSFQVKKDDIVIINNIERHKVIYEENTPLYETVIHFNPQVFRQFLREALELFDYDSTLFQNKIEVSKQAHLELMNYIKQIVSESKKQDAYSDMIVASCLLGFIALVFRHGNIYRLTPLERNNRGESIDRIKRILKYIETYYQSEISLGSIAEHFYMNPAYFSEYFKKMLGVTYSQYLRMIRIKHAKLLLEKGEKSIVDIMFDCGFSSVSAFYAAFLKETDISPKAYIKQKNRN